MEKEWSLRLSQLVSLEVTSEVHPRSASPEERGVLVTWKQETGGINTCTLRRGALSNPRLEPTTFGAHEGGDFF